MSGSTNPHDWGEHGFVMSGGDVTGFVLACGCRLNIYSATGTLRLDKTFHGESDSLSLPQPEGRTHVVKAEDWKPMRAGETDE